MSTAFCLDCDHEINLTNDLEVGQKIKCPNCQTKMEVVRVDPLRLDWAYEGPVTRSIADWDKGWLVQ